MWCPEVGDLVELTKDQHISGTKGEWGKVYRVSEPGSCIAFLSIQMAGYSRSQDAFFAAATSVPVWDVKPYLLNRCIMRRDSEHCGQILNRALDLMGKPWNTLIDIYGLPYDSIANVTETHHGDKVALVMAIIDLEFPEYAGKRRRD